MEKFVIFGKGQNTEDVPPKKDEAAIIMPESYGGPRSKELEEEMEELGKPVYGTKESDKRRREIEERLEDIEKDHQGWRDKDEKKALEEEMAGLEKKEEQKETEKETEVGVEQEVDAPEVTEEAYRRRGGGLEQPKEDPVEQAEKNKQTEEIEKYHQKWLGGEEQEVDAGSVDDEAVESREKTLEEKNQEIIDREFAGELKEKTLEQKNQEIIDKEFGEGSDSYEKTLEEKNQEIIDKEFGEESELEDEEEQEEPIETETAFARAMRKISREDPEAAERIRHTIGLESHPEEPAGEEFQEITSRQFEQQRGTKEKIGSWVKERVKGVVTFGWWETHQAEKFRVGTKEVAQDIEAQAWLISQEDGLLSQEGALEEADRMRELFEQTGMETPSTSEYEMFSGIVTKEKIQTNTQIEDRIVEDSLSQLEDRLKNNSRVQEYISYSGEQVITQERLKEVENRIRNSIRALRRGQVREDIINYKKRIREALDQDWYKRYVATGVEMALGVVAMKWAVSHMFTGTTEIAKGATEAIRGLKETVWDDTKGFLMDSGIDNPTDSQILEASKMVAQDSGVAVGEWNIPGDIVDTKMPAGYLLKFGRVASSIARIAAL